jgi:hypothetical protein
MEAMRDYLSNCHRTYRHGVKLKKKRQLKRSNPSQPGGAPTTPPFGKKPLDGPEYTVVDPVAPDRKGKLINLRIIPEYIARYFP